MLMRHGRKVERQRHAGQESTQGGRSCPLLIVVVMERHSANSGRGHGLQAGHQTRQVVRMRTELSDHSTRIRLSQTGGPEETGGCQSSLLLLMLLLLLLLLLVMVVVRKERHSQIAADGRWSR